MSGQKLNTCGLSAGVLACLDGYMNIAIEQTEEYVNGQLKNKYGDAFLRGNNGKIVLYSRISFTDSLGLGSVSCTSFWNNRNCYWTT